MIPTKNKSIFFFQTGDFPEGGGATARLKLIAQTLTSEGNKVYFNYFWPSSFSRTNVSTNKSGVYEGVNYKYLNFFKQRPHYMFFKLIDSIWALIRSFFLIVSKVNQIDVIYLYNPTFIYTWHIVLLAKLAGKQVIIERTELFSSLPKLPQSIPMLKRLLRWVLRISFKIDEKYTYLFCDKLVVISDGLFSHYVNQLPEDSIIKLPIIVNTKLFNKAKPKNKPLTIGYVGTFGYKDGVPMIIESFAKAKQTLPKLKLKLIGYADNKKSLLKQINSFNVSNDVEITGSIFSKELPTHLSECDLLICYRVDLPYAHLGFPTKVGEYLSTGITTLISRVGDLPKYLTKNDAIIVPPNDVNSLTEAVLKRYNEYENSSKIGASGKQVCINYFDISQHREAILNLINITQKENKQIQVS